MKRNHKCCQQLFYANIKGSENRDSRDRSCEDALAGLHEGSDSVTGVSLIDLCERKKSF